MNAKSQMPAGLKFKKIGLLYLFLVPAVLVTLVFNYLPMFSNYIAFLDYKFANGWMGLASPFVGLKNFSFVFKPWFWELAGRTVLYSSCMLVFSFPAPMILALLLNELNNQKFKKIVQTVSYIPHFISWVTVSGLFYLFLTVDSTGIVNNIRNMLGFTDRISFMQEPAMFLPFLIISQIWKEVGWGTILYLAALTTINPELYEAASIDGASRLQRMWHITFPGILPTTSILLIFSLGHLFGSNFDQVFNMQNSVLRQFTDTIDVFNYYQGVQHQQYSLSAAVGLFQGLVTFVLIMGTNFFTKKISNTGII